MTEEDRANLILLKQQIRDDNQREFEKVFDMKFRVVKLRDSDYYIAVKGTRGIRIEIFENTYDMHYWKESNLISKATNMPLQDLATRCGMLKWQIDNESL